MNTLIPVVSTSIETSTVITKPHTTPAGEYADAYLLIFNPLLDLDNSPSMSQLKFSWLLGEFCCEEKVDQVILNTPTAFDTERVRVHPFLPNESSGDLLNPLDKKCAVLHLAMITT